MLLTRLGVGVITVSFILAVSGFIRVANKVRSYRYFEYANAANAANAFNV